MYMYIILQTYIKEKQSCTVKQTRMHSHKSIYMRYDMDINRNSCYVQYTYMHIVAEYFK